MTELLANLATTTLANNLSSGGLSATVVSDAIFPSTGNFRIRIGSEIIIVSDTSGSNVMGGLTRGAEGTTAAAHVIGDPVRQVLTRDGLAQIILDGAGSSDPQLATLAAMDDTHATTLRDATAWGLALLLDANAADTKSALALGSVDNTPDSAKPVSTAQATADSTVPIRFVTSVATQGVLSTDIGKRLVHSSTGWTSTLADIAGGGPNPGAGGWFEIQRTTSGTATLAWTGAIVMNDSATGAPAVSPLVLDRYETLRVSKLGIGEAWTLEWRTPAAADITYLKEVALNIEDPSLPGGGCVAGPGNGAANRAAFQALLTYANPVDGAAILVPPGKDFEIASPGGANPVGLLVGGETVINLQGSLVATGAWAAGGALLKFAATTPGNQILESGMRGTGHLDCGDRVVDWAVMIDVLRRGSFREFTTITPKVGSIYVRNTSTNQDSDSILFDQINQRGANAPSGTPSRFMLFESLTAVTVSDMTVTNCKTQGGMQPQTTPGTLSTGGWAFELVNANRIEFNGGNFNCHHNFATHASGNGGNACYSGGWLIRATTGAGGISKSCDDNTIRAPYCEATPTSGTPHSLWEFNMIRLEVTSGAGSIDGTYIDCLHQSVSAPAALARRIAMARLAGTGTITNTKYRNPRNTSVDAGAFLIGSGCTNNFIETTNGVDATPDAQGNTGAPWTNNGGTTNRKKGLVP